MAEPRPTHEDWLQVDPSLGFGRPELKPLLSLWRSRCRDGRLPARADFDPCDLREHMGWIVLTDVEQAPLRFRFRLVGSRVAEMAGRDVTGCYLDEVYPPDIYRVVVAGYHEAIKRRQPVRVHGRFCQVDRCFLALESLELPLASDGDTVDMLMVRDCIGFAAPDMDAAAWMMGRLN